MRGGCPIVVTPLISLESTEQQTVLTLSFELYGLKFLEKVLQEGPRDSLSGTAPLTSTLTST